MSLILEALKKLEREKQAPERGFLVVGPAAWPSAREGPLRAAARPSSLAAMALAMERRARGRSGARGRPRSRRLHVAAAPAKTAPAPVAAQAGRSPPRMVAAPARACLGPRSSLRRAPSPGRRLLPRRRPKSRRPPRMARPRPRARRRRRRRSRRRRSAAPAQADAPLRRRGLPAQAISEQDGRPVAVINGQLVREGDTFDGARVVRIGVEEVEIEVAGARRIVKF